MSGSVSASPLRDKKLIVQVIVMHFPCSVSPLCVDLAVTTAVGFQMLRTSVEQISCSLRLLGFFPMHSDSQPFVKVAIWGETFTAITQV